VLKNFSHRMIALVLMFDRASVAAELQHMNGGADAAEEADSAAVTAACITACELVIKDAHLAGYTTISVASSEWTRQVADPIVSTLAAVCS
jgi:hypothetical protein